MARENRCYLRCGTCRYHHHENRKQYDRIRKMDHCQMTLWAESIYKSGFNDGMEAANEGALSIEQVRDALLSLKWFGKKRVTAVCEELAKKMNTESD